MLNAIDAAHILLKIQAIKVQPDRPFTWASGLLSPIYCDNRMLLSYPDERTQIIAALSTLVRDYSTVDAIVGVATAGIPHGALIADRLDLPFAYVRSAPKSHGKQNLIEGRLIPGQKVVVVEDLISTGGSSIKAVESVRQEGGEVLGVVAIFSYEFDLATINFDSINCNFKTISNYSALLSALINTGSIDEEQLSSLKAWRYNPQLWSNENKVI